MAEVLLFHHPHGLTAGVRDFAERLRRAGHTVHVPDLYEGRVFDDLGEGAAYAQEVGFGSIIERGRATADGLPSELVYAGFSHGLALPDKAALARPTNVGSTPSAPCSSRSSRSAFASTRRRPKPPSFTCARGSRMSTRWTSWSIVVTGACSRSKSS